MPIYDYLCEACDEEFSREQRITDAPLKTCPACRARRVKRLISQTSFVLKGGGWHSDLYGSHQPGGAEGESGKEGAGGSADAGGASDAGDGSGADAKPKSRPKSKPGSGKGKSARAA